MRVRVYICDVCGEIEDKEQGGSFYIFRYTRRNFGWNERHKMVMCHECFCKMLDFCESGVKIEWEESEAENETDN